MKAIEPVIFALLVSGISPMRCSAATYPSNGSAADVQHVHNTQAANGDTITIPSGTFAWSTPVKILKAIKLQGQGSGRIIGNAKSEVAIGTGSKTFTTTRVIPGITIGQTLRVAKMPVHNGPARENYMEGTVTDYSGTTLVLNVTSTGGSGTYKFWWIATKPATTIINAYNNSDSVLNVNQQQQGQAEISGIQFYNQGKSASISVSADAYSGPRTLIHDCWFQAVSSVSNLELQSNRVLIWNCSFDDVFSQVSLGVHAKWERSASRQSWNTASTMGANDTDGATNLYIEDCDFHAYLNAADFDDNIRAVFRRNILDNSGLGSHGADTSSYGVRHVEIYNNELIFDDFGDRDGSVTLNVNWFFWMRGGSGVINDNILPAINSPAWGSKGNILFSVLNTRRNKGPYCCWTNYPAPHQVGQGYGNGAVYHHFVSTCSKEDYSYYTYAEPVYVWNNSGTAGNSTGLNEESEDPCGHNQHLADWVQNGRDYIIGAKPGYQKFIYPHPLRGSSTYSVSTPSTRSNTVPTSPRKYREKKKKGWGQLSRKKRQKPKEGPSNQLPEGEDEPGQ